MHETAPAGQNDVAEDGHGPNRTRTRPRRLPIWLIPAAVLVASLLAFLALADGVQERGDLSAYDPAITADAMEVRNQVLTGFARLFTFLGNVETVAALALGMIVWILWRRRNILAVTAVTAAATAAHVLAFDWVTRCGVGLPLSFALAYAVGRFAGGRNHQILGVAGVVLVQFLVLVKDSSTGGLGPILATIPLGLLFWGAGRLVASRTTGPRAAERELATA